MTQTTGSKQRDIRIANHRLILSTIRQLGAVSRSELAAKLEISGPSVSKNVDGLLRRNVLVESGTVTTSVGRRPNMLEINPDYCCVAVVDFSHINTILAIADMRAEIIDEAAIYSGEKIGLEHIQTIINALQKMLEKHHLTEKLQAISIATPGILDNTNGSFVLAPRFEDPQNIHLQKLFNDAFDVTVLLKNDISMAALGESMFGAGKGIANQLYISIDHGVGSGLVLNQKLYEGSRGVAGEVGMWLTDPEQTYRQYRNRDVSKTPVFDSQLSTHAIRHIVTNRAKAGEESILSPLAGQAHAISFAQIVTAYQLKDPLCVEVVEEAAIKLGCVLKNLIEFLDVDIVIIGGEVYQFGDSYLELVKDFLQAVYPTVLPKVVWSDLKEKAGLQGAIGNALEFVFEQIVTQNIQNEA